VATSRKKRRYLQLTLNQTDPRPLERFAAAVGGNVTGPYAITGNGGRKPRWQWQRVGSPAAEVVERLWTYLSEPKREQITRVMEEVAAQ